VGTDSNIVWDRLVPVEEFRGEDVEDESLLAEMFDRADTYVKGFSWCGGVIGRYVGDVAIGGVVAVLLYQIVPASHNAEPSVWVVVGDLPPAYISAEDAGLSACALHGYVREVQDWIAAVKLGQPVDELMPLLDWRTGDPLNPTVENAADLEHRITGLEEIVLSHHTVDLADCGRDEC